MIKSLAFKYDRSYSMYMVRPRLSETTRQRLLEEGVSSFLIHGYHGTGIKHVLDQVKVPKGSFYNYFKSKEDFGAAAIQHYADCFGKKVMKALAGAPDPLTGLREFFETLMTGFVVGGYVGGCLSANLGGELEGSDVCRKTLASALPLRRVVDRLLGDYFMPK
jgi:TetR/AcrR family transcriptional repressor of nem operon